MTAEASTAVTSVHGSIFAPTVCLGDGDGVGLGDEIEDEPDDPHAPTTQPAMTITAIRQASDTVVVTSDWIGDAPG